MRKSLRIGLLGACALLAGPLALPSSAAPTAAAAGPTPVATGLAGPLHVSYRASDDTLLVADAFAGVVWRIDPATGQKAPAPGGAFPAGTFVTGADGAPNGGFYVTLTRPDGSTRLLKVGPNGERRKLADLLAYELEFNPDGQPQQQGDQVDQLSNPYDVLAVRGGAYVADAAANVVLFVSDQGKIRQVAVLPVNKRGACAGLENNGVPNGGCDPVPTDMFMPADGFLYVSGLGSEVEGRIWKIDPATGKIVRTWSGLPPLTGVAVDRAGRIYASSLFGHLPPPEGQPPTGEIIQITPGGGRSSVTLPFGTGSSGLGLHSGRLYFGHVDLVGGGPGSVMRLGTHAF